MADEKKRDYAIEMGEKQPNGHFDAQPRTPTASAPSSSSANMANNPIVPILAYCASSILMTTTNKYVVNGLDFNLNFFLLAVQVRRLLVQTGCCRTDPNARAWSV